MASEQPSEDRPAGDERRAAASERGRPARPDAGPESPRHLPKGSWWQVARRTMREFQDGNLTDWAAALTYYGVLSIFPGLIVLISMLGLLGQSTVNKVKGTVSDAAPGSIRWGGSSTMRSARCRAADRRPAWRRSSVC